MPKEDAEITLLWKWRRGRPAPTASETAVPDIQAMRKEMNNMKSSLKNYTSKAFFKDAVQEANKLGEKRRDGQPMATEACVLQWIRDQPKANSLKVYKVFFAFHQHNRMWQANVVDSWMAANNMELLKYSEEEKKTLKETKQQLKFYNADRAGWGSIVRIHRVHILKRLMRFLRKHQKYHLAVSLKSGRSEKWKYELKMSGINIKDKEKHYYTVVRDPDVSLVVWIGVQCVLAT